MRGDAAAVGRSYGGNHAMLQAGGCNEVVAQSNPPISIVGSGFGSFPMGTPYSGDSDFLEITDQTQNWSAGYTGHLHSHHRGMVRRHDLAGG